MESRGDPIARASNADLAFLAMDRGGGPPEQFAVILIMDGIVEFATVERLLEQRIAGTPRLRERLLRAPLGCGRPIWVGDEAFALRRHLTSERCRPPGDDDALLETVVPLVMAPLPRDRPPWRAVLVDGLAENGTALVLIAHHVLADGLGGLAVLDRLLDGRQAVPSSAVHRRPPALRLAADAMAERLNAARSVRTYWRLLHTSMTAGGGLAPARVQPCSLLGRTGARRDAAVVQADLPDVHDAAHRYGGTVNAALLTAVAAALGRVLATRQESLPAVVVAVPVAGRRPDGAGSGNAVSPLLVTVPTTGPIARRISDVTAAVRHRRGLASGPAPIALLGPLFRLIAAVGGYRWYMRHQRRLHTLVSYVRGPESVVRFGGTPVRALIPLVVGGATNITVAFQAMSYAGRLSVTVVADPDHRPDLARIADELAEQLAELTDRHEPRGAGSTHRRLRRDQ